MAILQVQHLTKYFGDDLLLKDICFDVYENERIGLVGRNGCGKTTLFRMILGEMQPDSGMINIAGGNTVMTVAQRSDGPRDRTLYDETLQVFLHLMEIERSLSELADELSIRPFDSGIHRQARLQDEYERRGGLTYRSRTRSVLMGLGFTEEELQKPVRMLSGGEERKAQLAKVLLSEASLLLLDEPTNHLDIRSIEWLEEFLLGYKGAYIVVSHDRYFLDRVTNKTIEIENCTCSVHKGNYTRHLELKSDEQELAEKKYYSQQKEIRRIRGIIEQQKRWNQAHNYVTIASKEKQIQRIQSEMVKPARPEDVLRFQFKATEASGNDVVIAKDLEKRFGEKHLFSNGEMHVLKGEHICLLGANGCGKTTLLKILMGQIPPDRGSFKIGANIRIGYYEQNMQGFLPSLTILEQMEEFFPRLDEGSLRNALGQFLFKGDDVFKKIASLSGGELARIQMLKLMMEGRNLLLLDEPTNHLDIPSREALERALCAYDGTMIVVTHDRYFVDRIADRILVLGRDGFRSFDGDWTAYSAQLAEERKAQKACAAAPAQKDNEYLKNKELRNTLNKARQDSKKAEQEIAGLEQQLEELRSEISAASVSGDYIKLTELTNTAADVENRLEEAYTDWQNAEELIQQLTE